MDYSFVAGKAIDSLRGSVGRVVVDNNQIEFEVRFLFQDRVDGIGNGAYTASISICTPRFLGFT